MLKLFLLIQIICFICDDGNEYPLMDGLERLSVEELQEHIVEIELLDKKEYTEQEELVNDMMMLIASFSGKVYSLRAQENRKKRKENGQFY